MSEDSELKCAHSLANFPVSPKSKRWNRNINQPHDLLKHQDLSVSMPSLEPYKKHKYKKYARTVGTQTRSQHHMYPEFNILKKGSSCVSMENTGTADVGDGASNVSDWRQMGRELRHIADDLRRSTPSLDSSGENEFFSLFYSNYFTHEMSQPARRRCFSAGASSVSDDDTQANYQRLDQLLSNLFDVLQQILMTQRRIREAQIPQNSPRLRNGQSNSRRNGDGTEPFLSFLPPDLPSLFTNTEARISADMLGPATIQSASSSNSPVELTDHNESRRYGCPTSSFARRETRRRRCRRRTMSDSTCCDESKPDSLQEVTASSQPEPSAQLWTQVGVNLRKIADEYYSSVGKAEPSQEYEEIKRPCGVESSPADTSLLSMLVPPPFAGSVWTAVIFVVGWRLLTRAR